MDLIPLHIEYLLTRHDCVIVPGFGAFIASGREARFDAESGIITPRRREISFNGSVVTDDGLLSHSIARRERLSYEDAHRLVANMVEKMKSDLINEGEVSVGMVGRLVRDSEGLVSFEPRRSRALSDIAPVARIQVANAAPEERTAAQSEKAVVAATPKPETAEVSADGMRTVRVAPDRYVFTISKRAAHAAAMLVAILTIGLSLMIPVSHDDEQKASVISFDDLFDRNAASGVDEEDSDYVVPTDSIAAETPFFE